MSNIDPTDDRQEAVLNAKAWKEAMDKTPIVDPTDDRQEAILRAKAWSKPLAKIVTKVKKKGKK